ncbi:branched-chain amino acid ABC transporter permease [Fundidesulfovibrio soli]|uniref:branched-chain amino acid ABC transporter permease n=1 Tax=Fundidesulfovibrio soli TaxID=2922716 RepID=UPI001FAF97C1|nr:branched-chain amino acid ABC transporter permease [Fundidesulfovibrio soli]
MPSKPQTANTWYLLIFLVVFSLVPVLKTTNYQMLLAAHVLVWGLFAVSFNMLFGVTGMLSFGQALYYGMGAYGAGLSVKYLGQAWFFPGMAIGIVLAAVTAWLLGHLIIRVSGVFFTMLTLAFGQLGWQVVFKWYSFTGGDDGVQNIIPPGIFSNKVVYYYLVLALVGASIWFLGRLSASPMGLILRCVRQNPERVRFLGRRVRRNQQRIYMISSLFTALAGGLMSGVDYSIHTDMFYWTTSGHVILMSILGGIGQFFGPLVGAAVIVTIEDVVGAFTEYWSLIIGTVMLVMVLGLPRGLMGEISQLWTRLPGRQPTLTTREEGN